MKAVAPALIILRPDGIWSGIGARPRRQLGHLIVWIALFILHSSVSAFSAQARTSCFPNDDESGQHLRSMGPPTQYLIGIDRFLESIDIWFLPDRKVCGMSYTGPVPIRFEGSNFADGKISLTFLAPPHPDGKEEVDSNDDDPDDQKWKRIERYQRSLFNFNLSGVAEKKQSSQLIIWNGLVKGTDGRELEFYFKRTPPAAVTQQYRGSEANYSSLKISVLIKKGSEDALRRDAKNLPISSIQLSKTCLMFSLPIERDQACFGGITWPNEEGNVVSAVAKKKYVIGARRVGGGAGTDTETLFLETNLLLSKNLRLNLPVAVPLFQQAISDYFADTDLPVPEPSSRQNSLFWELKGQRYQFLKIANPSPSDKSEWWKVRLQVAVTDDNVLVVGLPQTRVFSWSMDTVPNDEKFTTELDNDDRFLDLQGRLIVSMTKSIPVTKNSP